MAGWNDDEKARRSYWSMIMDNADRFMRAVSEYPVEECREPMVSLEEAAEAEGVDMSFSREPHAGGAARLFFLRKGLIGNFISAAREMNECGWVLKVEDAYRTIGMQRIGLRENIFGPIVRKVLWECGGREPPVDLVRRRFAALVAPTPKVGTHISGSAVDISVLSRDSGEELDRGGPYLEMSELTPIDSPFISDRAARNRAGITEIMTKNCFAAYPFEFWHYSGGDVFSEHINCTGRPARYGPVEVDLREGTVFPMPDPCEKIFPAELIEELMGKVLGENGI